MLRYVDIIAVVADEMDLEIDELMQRRFWDCVHARSMIFAIGRDMLGLSFPRLGQRFDMDHTTVMHSYDGWARYVSKRPLLAQIRRDCERRLATGDVAPRRRYQVVAAPAPELPPPETPETKLLERLRAYHPEREVLPGATWRRAKYDVAEIAA